MLPPLGNLSLPRPQTPPPGPDPSFPLTDRCLLLELPRELRDLIYEHALVHNYGLITAPDYHLADKFFVCNHEGEKLGDENPNQLQHVCHQLYVETRGIIFKVNDLIFKGESRAAERIYGPVSKNIVSGVDHFLMFFLRYGTLRLLSSKRAIVQYERSVNKPADIFNFLADRSLLSTICRQNPDMTVIVRFRYIGTTHLKAAEYFKFTNIYSLLFRGSLVHKSLPLRYPQFVLPMAKFLAQQVVDIHLPANLRLSLMCEKKFSVSGLRQDILRDTESFQLENTTSAQIEDLLAIAKKAFEDGL
ncbi:uncharacterized protein K460DRAFT_403855 [Cucurbitaria berberidis CBS 394.84]|uniref:Uncharacterized protein n=1 Tax=Cucurbitaria berberidis CBS 394.84 TaxID=1168544 RepID=A0A9P4LBP9_9PLEO|nr:uncharacterized protein K460DRAFT_403855 [Cucurbitaria berberidis CBS 394.84]KAF1848572.1 hypothetical protein K460DRAFT_403855 [Cucurbitaria berberidis CBS 394.84]